MKQLSLGWSAVLGLVVALAGACAGELENPERFQAGAGGSEAGGSGQSGQNGTSGQAGVGGSSAGSGGAAAGGTAGGAGGAAAGAAGAAGAAAGSGGSAGGLTGSATAGKTVYAKCQSCHGADGEGQIGPNLTPSKQHGLGDWTDAEIVAAIRDGKGKDGSDLCPTMARYSMAKISDQQMADLVAFLRSLAPVEATPTDLTCP